MLVFEELEHAKARGARIYAEVLGYGASADARPHHAARRRRHRRRQGDERRAARRASSTPTTIDYINAHGTSTPLGDKAETNAIKTVFGEHARKLSISSTKSQLGHLLGASGGVELVVCMMALRDSVCPADDQLRQRPTRPAISTTRRTQPRERKLRVVMSNSFGFGGHNASIIAGPAA